MKASWEAPKVKLEDWLGFLRETGCKLRSQVLSISGQPQARLEIRVGAGGDTTTFIDQWAEGLILEELSFLQSRGEDFTLLSEELGRRDFGKGGSYLLVDPIDGSLNAKRGIPFFSSSFALIEGERLSETQLGFVTNLANGDEFWAFRGLGAFFNGRPIEPKKSEAIEILAYEANRPDLDVSAILPLLPLATRTRCLGSTALDLCYTALGHIDLFIIPRSSRSFDLAAGKLILEEAQGTVTDLEGRDLGGLSIDLKARTSLVASSSSKIHQQAIESLRRSR
jgi:myo-inositol-1(or 4)-monophosphatase